MFGCKVTAVRGDPPWLVSLSRVSRDLSDAVRESAVGPERMSL